MSRRVQAQRRRDRVATMMRRRFPDCNDTTCFFRPRLSDDGTILTLVCESHGPQFSVKLNAQQRREWADKLRGNQGPEDRKR